jgi:hypothetical protein
MGIGQRAKGTTRSDGHSREAALRATADGHWPARRGSSTADGDPREGSLAGTADGVQNRSSSCFVLAGWPLGRRTAACFQ